MANQIYMKSITTLSCGITLIDNRSLGLGVRIENQNSRFIELAYKSNGGFYLSTKAAWLQTSEDVEEFEKESITMKAAFQEAKNAIRL